MNKPLHLALALLFLPSLAAAAPTQGFAAPFDLSTGRPIFALATSDGSTVEAMLDTGAQGAVIAQSLADTLKLAVVGEAQIGSPYGGQPMAVNLVALPPLSLGGFQLTKLEAVVMPDERLLKGGPKLTISSVQFEGRAYTLDFAANQIVIPAKANTAKSGWHLIDKRNMPITMITIGKNAVRLVLDTGNPGLLVLPRAFAEASGATLSDKPVGQIRTIDAAFDRYDGTFNRNAQIAGQKVRLGKLSVVDGMGANMGSKALAGFQLTIDMPNRRWRLDRADGKTPLISTGG
jgi:predicted aspartyl protease